MADIKCPMCGKSNPEGSETCQHCQARIKPVFSDSFDSSGDDGSLDWLNELSGGAGRQKEAPPSSSDEEKQQAQDWLSQIRRSSESSRSSQEIPEESEAFEEETAGWMQDLSNEEEAAPGTPAGEGNDWLNRFSSPSEPEGQFEEEEELPVSSPEPQGEKDDWLENLQSWQPEEESGWEEEKPVESWLSGLEEDDNSSPLESDLESREEEYRSPSAEAEDSDVPSWLQFLEEEMPDDQTPQVPQYQMPVEEDTFSEEEDLPPLQASESVPPQDEEDDDDLEIWLRSLDVDPESLEPRPSSAESQEPLSESSDSEEETLELSAFRLESDFESAEAESLPAEDQEVPQDDDLPEWLASGGKPETEEQPSEELPDWLRSSAQEESTASARSEAEGDLPEWLGAAAAAESGEMLDSDEQDLPEWLGKSGAEEEQTPPADLPPFASEEAELPDWLRGGERPQQIGQPAAPEEDSVTPFNLGGPETSKWMGEEEQTSAEDLKEDDAYANIFLDNDAFDETLGERSEDADLGPENSQELPPFVGEDLGEWFKDLGQIEIPEEEEAEGSLLQKAEKSSETAMFGDQEFTSLLSDAGLDEEDLYPESTSEEEGASGELEEVDLPDWLKAMRPIEAIAGEALDPLDERKVESAGPLAGLRSILPAEEIILHYQKPPIYSMKLQVSDKQRAQAGLLERMIEPSKAKPTAVKKESGISVRVLRLVVGLILLIAVLVPSFLPLHGPQPISTGEAVMAFYNQIESLPEGQTVLIAADFEDAYYGEMRLAAENVILHLSAKNSRLALVSTLPSGPVLGEALVKDVLIDNPQFYQQYQQSDWIENLGYLAGGLASLQEFSNTPRQAVQFGMQAGLTNEYIWSSSALKDVYRISDFGLVVLITDKVETGRAWAEQVQPVLGDTPFLLVTSAQAAPLLNAYYQAEQFDGLLAGYQDGMSYPLRPQGSGVDFRSWDSFYYGMLTAVVLLFAGILLNFVFSMFKRETREEAQS